MQTCVHDIYNRYTWPAPLPSGRSQPLLSAGPPFATWAPPIVPEAPASPEDPDF